MTTARRIGIWHVPVGRQAPAEVPAQWVSGLAAVSQDLQCCRYGRKISFDDVAWELTVQLTADRLAEAMSIAVNDPQLRDNARQLSARITAEDGAAHVVSLVSSLLHQPA